MINLSFPSSGAVFSTQFEQCYSHVYIQDYETMETTALDTGDESYSAGRSVVLVLTRPDTEGSIRVEYFLGDLPKNLQAVTRVVYKGPLDISTGTVSLTTVGAAEEDLFDLPHGGIWQATIATFGDPKPYYIAVSFKPLA
jgi:hypothetical protein